MAGLKRDFPAMFIGGLGRTRPPLLHRCGGWSESQGDPDIAHLLIEAAADCGVDAIKFQVFDPKA